MDELEQAIYMSQHQTMPIPTGNETQPIPQGSGLYRSGQVWVTAQEERRSRYEQSQRPSDAKILGYALALLVAAVVIASFFAWMVLFA